MAAIDDVVRQCDQCVGALTQRSNCCDGPVARVGCALLRTGLDPAYVLINVAMPRYTLNERDCTALWRYLNGGVT